tara:strand:+ start:727 stop:1296 length:570 start_codon:yes stop_codon:yes gene_type:complete
VRAGQFPALGAHRPQFWRAGAAGSFDPAVFREKKQAGQSFEQTVKSYFEAQGFQCWKDKGDDAKYDLNVLVPIPLWGTVKLTCEIKADFEAVKTGRLALQMLERTAGGKVRACGIHPKGPRPDIWIHGIGDPDINEMWIIRLGIIHSCASIAKKSWAKNLSPMGQSKARGIFMPLDEARKTVGGQWVTL